MKIVLINPSIRPDYKRKQLPVGLGYIALALQKENISFDLIDMDINNMSMNELENLLNKNNYDLYALGCIVSGFKYAKKIAEIVRKINSEAIIVAGNSLASSIPELLLYNTDFDITVIGEGDQTIVELIKSIEKKSTNI